MADLSKIKLNGTEYDLKDAAARNSVNNLATVATSGSYNDLSNKPTIKQNQEIYFVFNTPDWDGVERNAYMFTNINGSGSALVTGQFMSLFNEAAKIDYYIAISSQETVQVYPTYKYNAPSSVTYIGEKNGYKYIVEQHGTGGTVDEIEVTITRDLIPTVPTSDITANTNARHTHSNKALLDTYTQTEANLADAVSKKHEHSNKSVLDSITTEKISAWDSGIINHADKTELPLIVTGTCSFGPSLISGTDSVLSISSVSHTVAQIATAVTANRPIYFVLTYQTDVTMKIMLQYSAFDGSAYYFTNAYDPFTQTVYDNESFNITVKASNITDVSDSTYDSFVYAITYNKNAFVTQSDMTSAINTAIGNVTEFDTQVVQTLPSTGVVGTIYFTPNNHGTNDIYDEFIYVNNAWEKIGNTQVDLTGYARTNQLANVAITGSYNNLVDVPDIPEKTSDLTNDSNFITLADVPTELPAVTSSDNGKVLTVVNGDWDKANVPTELPSVTSSDNGKILTVSSGTWAKGDLPEALPTVSSSDNGKILTVSNGTWAKGDVPTELPTVSSSDNDKVLAVVNGAWATKTLSIPQATVVTQTITSGVKIAEINGTAIYAPAYTNGDQIAY